MASLTGPCSDTSDNRPINTDDVGSQQQDDVRLLTPDNDVLYCASHVVGQAHNRRVGPVNVTHDTNPMEYILSLDDVFRMAPCLYELYNVRPEPRRRHVVRAIHPRLPVYRYVARGFSVPPDNVVLENCMETFLRAFRLSFPHAADRSWVQHAALLSCTHAILVFCWGCTDAYLISPTWSVECARRRVLTIDCDGMINLLTESPWWHLERLHSSLRAAPIINGGFCLLCPWCNALRFLPHQDIQLGTFRCGNESAGRILVLSAISNDSTTTQQVANGPGCWRQCGIYFDDGQFMTRRIFSAEDWLASGATSN